MTKLAAAPLAREAAFSAATTASLAALLLWLGPPGIDLAGHVYQRLVFLQHGFALWNNFWYAGRYSFVTYSVLYYPLAGLLGIKVLALASVTAAALAFAIVIGREWGPAGRLSSRTFAVVWAGTVLSAAFPFALGAALALLAIWALQEDRRGRFSVLALLTLAASPLAFVLLAVVLAGIGLARRSDPKSLVLPAAVLAAAGALELVLFRLFPGDGRFPFSTAELAAAIAFCTLGLFLTWRVERARALAGIFAVYLVVVLVAYAVPSQLGENIARMRYAALPIALLAVSLRGWRPLRVVLPLLLLAASWNLTPLAANFAHSANDPAAARAYFRPAVVFLRAHLTPSYRVEAVDTAGHWPAVYLPAAGIPLVRGWFRQDDFPVNGILYGSFGARGYRAWLRELGVRYVLLTDAPPDYSARDEAALLASGRSGLEPVFRSRHLTVFALPRPQPLVTGPFPARVQWLGETRMLLRVDGPGSYRVAVRYSPYWHALQGCVDRGPDGMVRVTTARATRVGLRFGVNADRALDTLVGSAPTECAGSSLGVRSPG